MEIYKYNGKNIKDILNLALYELNVSEKDIIYHTDDSKSNLFRKSIDVEIILKEELKNYVIETIKKILKEMKIKSKKIVYKIEDDTISINLESNKNSNLIGKNAYNLRCLNVIMKSFMETRDIPMHVKVDVNYYNQNKERQFKRNIEKIAREVIKTGVSAELDPMNSYDRRNVHSIVSKYDELVTISKGEEPERYVIISKK